MILFLKFHPALLKTSMLVISNFLQPFFKLLLSSSLERINQLLIQYVPLKSTCKNELGFDLWNTTSFLLNHKAQQMAAAPIKKKISQFRREICKPRAKKVSYTAWWLKAKRYANRTPNPTCQMTLKNTGVGCSPPYCKNNIWCIHSTSF